MIFVPVAQSVFREVVSAFLLGEERIRVNRAVVVKYPPGFSYIRKD